MFLQPIFLIFVQLYRTTLQLAILYVQVKAFFQKDLNFFHDIDNKNRTNLDLMQYIVIQTQMSLKAEKIKQNLDFIISKQDLVTTELQSSKGLNLLRFYYRSLIVFSFILHYADGLYTLLVNVLLVPCFLQLAFQNWGDSQSFSYLLKNSIHVICFCIKDVNLGCRH